MANATLVRLVALSATLVLAASQPAACQKGKNSEPDKPVPPVKSPTCSTVLDPPIKVGGGPLSAIAAYSHTACTETPARLVINLKIEKLTGGTWYPVNGFAPTGSFRTCEALPIPGSPVACEWAVPCSVGQFRTTALVTGSSLSHVDYSFTVPMKPMNKVKSC